MGKMTKPEKMWAWLLQEEKNKGLIDSFMFEQITLYLSDPAKGTKRVSYTPDFVCVLADGSVRVDEIKGPFIREDSELKFKIAADRFPWIHWRMVQIDKKFKEGFRVIRELGKKNGRQDRIQAVVDEQAEDEGLWFKAKTAPEGYLQQELRRLHAVIEIERGKDG